MYLSVKTYYDIFTLRFSQLWALQGSEFRLLMWITESRDTNTNRNRGKIPKPNRLGMSGKYQLFTKFTASYIIEDSQYQQNAKYDSLEMQNNKLISV